MVQSTAVFDPVLAGYVLVFGVTALACFASVGRARDIDDRETRWGLVALLLTSGGWALTHVAFFIAPGETAKTAIYTVGLVVGFSTVGPWLYFSSAYTGRTLHRNTALRRLAVAVFLVIVAIKVTNPWHGLYFATEPAAAPFSHLSIVHQPFHWIAMGLSYALAAVGYFMFLERLLQVSYDTRPLALLVTVTGLPLVLDLVGYATPWLVDITYEPIGVAVFAVGVCFVFLDRFRAIRIAGGEDKPVLIVTEEDLLREYNAAAADLFPALAEPGTVGRPLWSVVPAVAEALETEPSILTMADGGEQRYYQLAESPFAAGQTPIGRLILVTDITDRERDRRELKRQNERLDRFASVVSHDLRNPLQVLRGALDGARETGDPKHFDRGEQALDRMETLIDDVLSLARQGQPIDETQPVSLATLVEECWTMIETGDAELVVDGDLGFVADPDRLRQLVENLVRNAVEHGGGDVTVGIGPLPDGTGFYVEDDGRGIPASERSEVFESGYSTAENGTGFGLAIVSEIVDAHGWTITATDSAEGGTRFEISGVTTVETPAKGA